MKILIEQFKNRIEVEYKSSIKTAMHLWIYINSNNFESLVILKTLSLTDNNVKFKKSATKIWCTV